MTRFVFSLESRKKLNAYAQSIEPSSARAQCYQLANLKGDSSIADAIAQDHYQHASALRAARLVVEAGAAEEINATKYMFGTFVFEDESQLK
ncbi:hypothetical protein ABMX62_19160 [Vibrio vulnificus]|uniref:hypothetical protein n=1 Tax=Vibrio vulnificus TaxID=672 RepID=UPI004059732F